MHIHGFIDVGKNEKYHSTQVLDLTFKNEKSEKRKGKDRKKTSLKEN